MCLFFFNSNGFTGDSCKFVTDPFSSSFKYILYVFSLMDLHSHHSLPDMVICIQYVNFTRLDIISNYIT